MPFFWKIDSRRRMLEIEAEGELGVDDCVQLVELVAGAQCLPYGKLMVVRGAVLAATHEELMRVIVLLREYHGQGPLGPLAIVTAPDRSLAHPQILGALGAANRPIRIFTSELRARRWLDGVAQGAA